MSAVSQKISNLLGGVSQQPDPVKLPGQVREAVNVYLDPTFGCKKRPPTVFKGILASDIPEESKWIPIFRDQGEKYIICIYRGVDGVAVIRVWDAITAEEKNVTYDSRAADYLFTNNLDNISTLTLADYTLIANKESLVSLSEVELEDIEEEALIMINAVAYNTSYSVDLSRDGDTEPTKAFRAKAVEISPASWQANDGGFCSATSAQSFVVSGEDGTPNEGKVGLSFRITTSCSAFLNGDAYSSRYSSSVALRNGGQGWRKGDQVVVTMAGVSYTITVTEETFDYVYASDGSVTHVTPPDVDTGALVVGDVTSGLVDGINALDGYSAETTGNVIRIRRTDKRSFNLGVRGGTTNRSMSAIKSSAANIAKLPDQCWDGYRVKVVNTDDVDADDYYVQFKSDAAGIPGAGAWEETTARNIPNQINSSSMPFALIRQADGDFIFKPLDDSDAFGGWASRTVGDEDTNPAPSFVGRGISGMFFYQNRLGILSEDAVIMSQPGDYFNFWAISALAISDADPIDMTAASTKPAFLKYATGVTKGLLLFAENNQFLLSADGLVFSPNTVRLNEIADYNYRSATAPVPMGLSIGFVTEAETYSKVFEMVVDSADNRPQIAEITRAIPEYIPTGLTWSGSSPNNSFSVWGDGSTDAYVFKFFNQGNERQLAGWAKWTLPGYIQMWDFDNDTSYIVVRDEFGNFSLLQMEMLDDPDSAPISTPFGSKFLPRLDYQQNKTQTRSVVEQKLYFNPGQYPGHGAKPVLMVLSGESEGTFYRLDVYNDAEGHYVIVDDYLASQEYVLGIEYEMRVELPSFYVIQENKADRIDNPVVEFLYVDLYQSGRYELQIDKIGYPTYSYDIDVSVSDITLANSPLVDEVRTESVPIFSLGRLANATIVAADPNPAAITGYSWQGHYNKRGIRAI